MKFKYLNAEKRKSKMPFTFTENLRLLRGGKDRYAENTSLSIALKLLLKGVGC